MFTLTIIPFGKLATPAKVDYVRKKIKLLINILFLLMLLLTNSKAELTNKIIISVGNEIISVMGKFKNFKKSVIYDELIFSIK